MLLPLQGVSPLLFFTQGDALGYVLIAPSGRCRANAISLILDKKTQTTYLRHLYDSDVVCILLCIRVLCSPLPHGHLNLNTMQGCHVVLHILVCPCNIASHFRLESIDTIREDKFTTCKDLVTAIFAYEWAFLKWESL